MAYTGKSDGVWVNVGDTGGGATTNLIDAGDANRWEANQLDAHTRLSTLETLTSPAITPIVQAYASSLTINATVGNSRIVTATGDLTLNAPASGTDGQMLRVRVIASGAQRVVTFAAALKRPSSMASTLTIPSGLRGDVGLAYESAYGWTVLAAQVA